MELIRGIHNIKPQHKGCVLTIGNFDGVHLGHMSVLAQLKASSVQHQLPSVVMTFEPQPVEVFNPAAAPARLIRWRDKYQLLQPHVDRLLCVRFNRAFANLPADEFVSELLVNKLGVKHLVIGDDFKFGYKRQGDFHLLQVLGERYNFSVEDTQSCILGSERVSSTAIRQRVANSDFTGAEKLLGRPYSVWGTVVHGAKNGRTIGFPTANILMHRKVSPVSGVFAVQVKLDGVLYDAVANVGYRPTLNGTRNQLEVHIFDFNGDLYQKRLQVIFKHKIRAEQKFQSLAALQQQIALDCESAKQFFALERAE
ncbi:bifunctional riboflavin kinase/FMN adenylyltransferase [Catenovulum agarivorans DS-2]|uniref:Riboflavin biosynthesis protein n=1 Tax=Catenovulum agarivorans DS-2 TaxID=1328313 RepID=W7QJ83_9ALTE|nr:bifunctional riboflavin kinase/FAD synthetase [Catenovulum agarivorans]EWH09002.1 bifunctional riboflavin kinase/FMN adenylyltransferase [Catenovulum agarivorans DS-2]